MRTAMVVNLGCKVNYYDACEMKKILNDNGYIIIDDESRVDVYIVNTCSVTSNSDKKSRNAINRIKKYNSSAVVIAAGCYAQMFPDELKGMVDFIIGIDYESKLPKVLSGLKKSFVGIDFKLYQTRYKRQKRRVRAFVKIQDGCDNFCSYCIIPHARGSSQSMHPDMIYDRIEELCDTEDVKEVILTGIDISSYGKDLGYEFINLLEYIHRIKNLKRIRLSSINIGLLDDNFIKRVSKLHKICPHFHVSLQSGSDEVLKLMNRKYTAQKYCLAVEKLRNAIPNVSVSTDVIVGFPGETDKLFEETCMFVRKMRFSKLHVFPFSPRSGTVAYDLNKKNKVDQLIKKERARHLMNIGIELETEYTKQFVEKEVSVLVESKDEQKCIGYTRHYIKTAIYDHDIRVNEIVKVIPILYEDRKCLIARTAVTNSIHKR